MNYRWLKSQTQLTFLSFFPLSDQTNLETSFEHLDLVDGDHLVAFDFGRNAEQQLVREQQPNSKQSLIESHDSGFSFEKSPSQTKFAKPSQSANETNDPLYKTKTIKKRSHPSRNIRRQFKLDSLDCSFDDSLNTISSVDSNKPESATENSNSLDLDDEEARPASDLNNKARDQRDAQHDRSPNASERASLDENLKKANSRSNSSRKSDKKSSGYLISKEEFKKRISSESVHLPDHQSTDRFEESDKNGKKRNKSRNSKKQLNKQASSTTSIAVKGKNQPFPRNYRKSSSATSLTDEQAVVKPPTSTTRTISSLKHQMLDIVSSVSRSPEPERLSDRFNGKSSDNLGDKLDGRTPKKAGDKQPNKFQQNNLRNLVENTSTVTTKSVSSFKKAYLRTAACALENSNVFNKKRNSHRHHYNGCVLIDPQESGLTLKLIKSDLNAFSPASLSTRSMFNLNTCATGHHHHGKPPAVMFNSIKFKSQKCRIKAFQVGFNPVLLVN